MEKKNPYSSYKDEKYTHYRNVPTGQYEKQKVKSAKLGERLVPITEKVKVSFDEVKELKLDSYGVPVPTLDTEDFTIVSNYLFDFWGAILGDSVVSTYLHLKRHAYGKKDYCYIDIELIALKMGKSKNPVKGYLNTLEEYGFIAIFLRQDVNDRTRDVSPFFKIRKYVPLITEDMYNSLHPKMQKLHDEFMEQFENINLNITLPKTHDLVESIVEVGETINSKATQEKIDKMISEVQLEEFVLNSLPHDKQNENSLFAEYAMGKVSKPSFDTWLRNTVLVTTESSIIVLSSNEFTRDWLENHYVNLIREWAESELGLYLVDIRFELIADYIRKNLNRGA